MKKKGKKSNTQLIIDALFKYKSLRSKDISEIISKKAGRHIKIQDVASMLSRISDSKKCDLGNFIIREQEGNGYVYNVAKEALALSERQAYDLTLKSGKNRYTLDQAVEDFPELRKYVKSDETKRKSEAKPKKSKTKPARAAKKTTEKYQPAKEKTEEEPVPETVVMSPGSEDIEKLANTLIQKIGGLNVNVKVSFSFDG